MTVRYDDEAGTSRVTSEAVASPPSRSMSRRRTSTPLRRGRLMATSRSWRPSQVLDGPRAARIEDIPELNDVFSDSFTERYRRDGSRACACRT